MPDIKVLINEQLVHVTHQTRDQAVALHCSHVRHHATSFAEIQLVSRGVKLHSLQVMDHAVAPAGAGYCAGAGGRRAPADDDPCTLCIGVRTLCTYFKSGITFHCITSRLVSTSDDELWRDGRRHAPDGYIAPTKAAGTAQAWARASGRLSQLTELLSATQHKVVR